MDVSRASQTHQVPHVGLPHIEPVTKQIKAKEAPMGAQHLATISAIFIRHTNTTAPAIAMVT